jgi:hypothetical protein
MDDHANGSGMVAELEPAEPDRFSAMTDRELAEHNARQLARLEPLLHLMENPPPAMAAMMGTLG